MKATADIVMFPKRHERSSERMAMGREYRLRLTDGRTLACLELGDPRRPGAPKPFCMNYGRDLVPGWERPDAQQHGTAHCAGGRP